jgi:hypothetical protein
MRKKANKLGSVLAGLLALFLGPVGYGQTQVARVPDCPLRSYTFTLTGVSADVDNTGTGCLTWVMEYEAVGFSAISLQFEAAPAATINATTGAATAGTYVAWAGTITNGVNPVIVSPGTGSTRFTDTSSSMMQGYYAAFVHLNLASATGSGTVKVSIYGFRGGPDANTTGGGSSGGCAGTAATPCIVAGPDAPGAVSTQNPVQMAGNDGTDVRAIRTDTTGRQIVVGAAAGGAAVAGNPVLIAGTDTTNAQAMRTDTSGRPNVVGAAAAGAAVAGNPLEVGVDDGTNTQYLRSTSAANQTASLNVGAALVEKGPRWSVFSSPATGSQATASRASGGGGVRHVADCITFSGSSVLAPALSFLTLNLRDGATGAGTILLQYAITVDAAVGQNILPFSFCGLGMIGSAATAMTLEFSAGVTNVAQTLTLTGYDVN